MFRRPALHTSIFLAAALGCAFAAGCSSKAATEDTGPAKKDTSSADGGLTAPVPSGGLPASQTDAGTTTGADAAVGGIQGPTFNLAKVSTIEGTFVTEKAPIDGLQTNATVTWSFKIQNITPPPSTTATWSAQATNVVGGNLADFPPVSGLALSLGASPSPAQWEFYADDFGTPRNYVLIQYGESHILDFYFYRRLIDDTEPQPVADKPKNITYTVK